LVLSGKWISQVLRKTGATGLDPATSGVTGRARASTILHGATQKNPDSREFGSASNVGFADLALPCPTVTPHPGLIVCLNECGQLFERCLQLFELSLANLRAVDDDDGTGHASTTSGRNLADPALPQQSADDLGRRLCAEPLELVESTSKGAVIVRVGKREGGFVGAADLRP
jgi:hypothetical protein